MRPEEGHEMKRALYRIKRFIKWEILFRLGLPVKITIRGSALILDSFGIQIIQEINDV